MIIINPGNLIIFLIFAICCFFVAISVNVAQASESPEKEMDNMAEDAALANNGAQLQGSHNEEEFALDSNGRNLHVWTFNSGRYIVVKSKLTWDDAEYYCNKNYHTHLATVKHDDDWHDLFDLWKTKLSYANCWIGCHELFSGRFGSQNREGWFWASGWHYDSSDAFWVAGEPNRKYEHCCYLNTKQKFKNGWDDGKCCFGYYFICDAPEKAI